MANRNQYPDRYNAKDLKKKVDFLRETSDLSVINEIDHLARGMHLDTVCFNDVKFMKETGLRLIVDAYDAILTSLPLNPTHPDSRKVKNNAEAMLARIKAFRHFVYGEPHPLAA